MMYPPGLRITAPRQIAWLTRTGVNGAYRGAPNDAALLALRIGPRRAALLGQPAGRDPRDPPVGWKYPPAPADWEGSDQEWWEQAEVGQKWDADGNHYTKTGPWEFSEEPSGG